MKGLNVSSSAVAPTATQLLSPLPNAITGNSLQVLTSSIVPHASSLLDREVPSQDSERHNGPRGLKSLRKRGKRSIDSLGCALFVITLGCSLWTVWLILLTVHPNDTINAVMKTKSYDDGSFWLLVEPTLAIKAACVCGFAIVLGGHAFILFKLTRWRKRAAHSTSSSVKPFDAAERTLDSLKSNMLQSIAAIANDERRTSATRSTANFALDLASEATASRKKLNAAIKIGEFGLQLVLLRQSLENGCPLVLIYILTVIITLNAVSCVLMMCFKRFQLGLLQVLVDCFFAFLIAIGFPMLVLVYCLTTFKFDSKRLAINLAVFPPGLFERQARVTADPVAVANVLNSLNSLRIQSVTSFFTRVGTNLLLCFQFVKLAASRGRFNPSLYPYRHSVVVLFVLLPIGVAIYISQSVQTSQSACVPHPECVVHAFRWIALRNGDKTQCPCLALIDENVAPKTYAEWQQPVNVMDKVAQLATSGDLRTVQITNKLLPTLPDQLRGCKNLKHLSLVYTHTEMLPSWTTEFTKLEFLHIEGALGIPSLVSLPVDLFDDMHLLTFLHLAVHEQLRQLPSFRGLAGLRSLLLALLLELEEVPELTSLTKLERLTVSLLFTLEEFPDMAPIRNLLGFVLIQSGRVCCNGFLDNQCNLNKRACYLDPAWNSPSLLCLPANRTTKIASDATRKNFARFPMTVCSDFAPPANKEDQRTQEADVDACNGALYRRCKRVDGRSGICYSLRMMPIACNTDIFPILMRKQQILENVGDKCDPRYEAWLGCPTS